MPNFHGFPFNGLTVDFSPIANAHNQNAELPVFDVGDDSIVVNLVLPELAKLGTPDVQHCRALNRGLPRTAVTHATVRAASLRVLDTLLAGPIFDNQPLNTLELVCVARDQYHVACLGLSRNQDVVRPDGCAY